jgi:hypothetical protein
LKTLLAEQSRLKRDIKAEKENKAASGPLLRLPITASEPEDPKQSEETHSAASQSKESPDSADQSAPLQPESADQSGEERQVCLRDVEEKLREIMLTMEVKRSQQGRPYDLLAMSLEQLCQEKAELQVLLIGKCSLLRLLFLQHKLKCYLLLGDPCSRVIGLFTVF